MAIRSGTFITSAIIAVAAFGLAGCAGFLSSKPDAEAEAPAQIEAAETCAALTDPLSSEHNSTTEFESGQLDITAYSAALSDAEKGLQAVPVEPDTELSEAVSALLSYEKIPSADGSAPITLNDYANLISDVGLACENAGSSLTIRSNTGG
ncbi:hypothetical protein ABIE21_003278 [Conyzicola nivalis]|uniref:Lipoprotein n=1 Tax=Conyzicola nivalis TaxID=1477021 RepID=A0ABV2QRX7_9MICO